MTPSDDCPETAVSRAHRLLVVVRTAVAILVGLATLAATLGWL